MAQVECHAAKFSVSEQLDELRDEHLVVVCDGARSRTGEKLGIFGRGDNDVYNRAGRNLEDVVLGLGKRLGAGWQPSAAVVWTVAQSRFLLNPGADGSGFLRCASD